MISYRKLDSFLFFILSLAVLSCLPVFSKRASPSQDNSLPQLVDDHFLSEIKKIAAAYRRCLLDQLFFSKEIWERIPSAIEACTIGRFWQLLDVRQVKIPSENVHYVFIPPKSIYSTCIAVRMNILQQWLFLFPEKTLRRMMPQCEFFGSGQEDIVNFRSIGKFYKKLITSFTEPPDHMYDVEDGKRISVAQDPYYPVMVKEKTFLEKYVKRPRIDYLWIHPGIFSKSEFKDGTMAIDSNTRFHEFSILQHPINVTICQLTIEATIFYYNGDDGIDLMRYARPKFKPLFLSLLSKSSFLPIRAEYRSVQSDMLLKLFYVNMSDPYCAKKYLAICDSGECQNDDFYEE